MNVSRRLFRLPLFSGIFILLFTLSINCEAKQLYTTDGVNIRKEADASSPVCLAVSAGTAVTKTGQNGNWIKVSADGVKGYIYKDYLSSKKTSPVSSSSASKSSSDSGKASNSGKASRINSSDVNLRTKPNSDCKVKAVLSEGETVTILSTEGNWKKIRTEDGSKGYVYSSYVGTKTTSTKSSAKKTKADALAAYRSRAISYAKNHLDDIYSQEKRDEEGYADCSSLVRDAYEAASGEYIGGTTTTQTENMSGYLHSISSIFEVTPGDIVYHLSDDNHAGIYIGNGKVIHASQTAGTVKVSSYDSGSTYWEYSCNAAAYCYKLQK